MVTHSPSSSVYGLWNVTFLLLPSRDGAGLLSPWNRGMTTQLALANEAQAHMTQVEAQRTLVQWSLISFAAWGFHVKKSGLVSLRMREHMETDSTNFQADWANLNRSSSDEDFMSDPSWDKQKTCLAEPSPSYPTRESWTMPPPTHKFWGIL